jgi:hypothetical protein
MVKRGGESISASVVVRFFHDESRYSGIVTNLSENDMCINTGMCLPRDSRIELLIPMKKEDLNVPVKVSRVVKTYGFYDTMEVKVLNAPKKYLALVENLRSAL